MQIKAIDPVAAVSVLPAPFTDRGLDPDPCITHVVLLTTCLSHLPASDVSRPCKYPHTVNLYWLEIQRTSLLLNSDTFSSRLPFF